MQAVAILVGEAWRGDRAARRILDTLGLELGDVLRPLAAEVRPVPCGREALLRAHGEFQEALQRLRQAARHLAAVLAEEVG